MFYHSLAIAHCYSFCQVSDSLKLKPVPFLFPLFSFKVSDQKKQVGPVEKFNKSNRYFQREISILQRT